MEERFYQQYARIQDQHWWFAGRRKIIVAELAESLAGAPAAGRRLLDIGCGTGTMLGDLSRFGVVEGVDDELAAVEFCHSRGRLDVQQAPANSLPFDDASFDVATLMDVIEHVDDDRAALAEAARVVRPSGRVLVTVPAYQWMWGQQDLIAHHKRRYTRPRLLEALADAGLEVARATYFNTLLFAPIAAIRLLGRLRASDRSDARSDFELNRPGPLNSLLAKLFAAESTLLRRTELPFGVSVLAIARRPARLRPWPSQAGH